MLFLNCCICIVIQNIFEHYGDVLLLFVYIYLYLYIHRCPSEIARRQALVENFTKQLSALDMTGKSSSVGTAKRRDCNAR